jgi:hypothetical protein
VNLLNSVAYYSVNNGAPSPPAFCRYTAPQASVALSGGGTASQARNHAGRGPATLTVNGASGYADDGFFEPLGTLGQLAQYRINAKGSTFGSNLWLDTNTANDTSANGNFFTWSGDCLSSLDGDSYGLGPSSTGSGLVQSETVNGSSSFSLTCNAVYGPVTLAQLQGGFCAGITASTPVAIWIGITVGSGGSLSTKITSAKAKAG